MHKINIKVATKDMAVKNNWINEERTSADPLKEDFNNRLKELYALYKEMCGTGNLLARFYYGTVLFYEAELNKHGIVQENVTWLLDRNFLMAWYTIP